MKHKSEDLKLTVIQYFYKNPYKSFSEISRIFNCSRRSINRWIEQYNLYGNVKRKERCYISYKVTNQHIDFAINKINENVTISLKELHSYIKNNFNNFDISIGHLGKVIKDNNFSRKRTKHGHFPKFTRSILNNKKKKVTDFYDSIKNYDISKIICIDETCLNPFMYKKYGRSLKGRKCVITTDNNKVFTKHTFIAAITNNKTIGWELYNKGSMNTERFYKFIQRLIVEKSLKGYLFIFDNASSHKNKEISKLIIDSGNFIIFTVPYSPQTNAIENFFSQFKHYLSNSKTRTILELANDIKNVLKIIKTENYINYFNYSYKKIYNIKNKKIYKNLKNYKK